MTFDKYAGKFVFHNYVFPRDGYIYSYEWNKEIGWHIVRGEKLPEFTGEKWYNDFQAKEIEGYNNE